jgi:hypothetical protein
MVPLGSSVRKISGLKFSGELVSASAENPSIRPEHVTPLSLRKSRLLKDETVFTGNLLGRI